MVNNRKNNREEPHGISPLWLLLEGPHDQDETNVQEISKNSLVKQKANAHMIDMKEILNARLTISQAPST